MRSVFFRCWRCCNQIARSSAKRDVYFLDSLTDLLTATTAESPTMAAWIVSSAFLVCAAILYVCLRCGRYRRLASVIPGPRGLPLLGNVLTVSTLGANALQYWTEQCSKFGSTWKLWLGPILVVTITDPHDVQVVFDSSKTLSKPAPYRLFRLLMGNALFAADTADWKKLRRIMEPAFNVQTLATFVRTFDKTSALLIQVLEQHSGGEAFDLEDCMMTHALDAVVETIFGAENSVGEENKSISVKNFQDIKSSFYDLVMKPWFWFECIVKITPAYKNFVNLSQPLLDYVDIIVRHKKESKANIRRECNEDISENCKRYVGFLDFILSNDDGKCNILTDHQLRDQTIGLMVGGIDSTALTMSIALMLLGLHQDVQRRVVEELEDIFGSSAHREVTPNDLKQMVYLEKVINETMRLFPVSPVVARQAQEDIVLSDYMLPARTTIIIPIFQMHRDPRYVSRPHEFDPDRFDTSTAQGWRQSSFVPFTGGRRICIAKNYSYLQMKTTLSSILRNYEIIPCGSRDEMECLTFELMLKLVHGYKVKIKKREWRCVSKM